MKAVKKPLIELTGKSFRYTFKDRRKLFSLILVLLLPFVGQIWRAIPENIEFVQYGHLYIFIYTFVTHFSFFLIAIAWFLTIHRRDFALQILAMAAICYGIFVTFDTLPITNHTPLWLDILTSLVIFIFVCAYIYYIYKNYVNRSIDYKVLHDGIVHDLHHERFLNEISRIEGLMDMAEMEEPYKSICQKEIAKLKESVAYIAEKYSDLK